MIAESLIAAIASILSATIAGVAAMRSKRAMNNTEPISNGFAGKVTASLEGLEKNLQGLQTDIREIRTHLIEHIENHD